MLAACMMGSALITVGIAEVPDPPTDGKTGQPMVRHTGHVGAHADWCFRHVTRSEFRLAIEDCDVALTAYPTDAKIYSNRGSARMMLHQPDLAIPDFEVAIRLTPDNAELHYNRATAFALVGKYAKAIDGYTDAIRFGPKFSPAYFNRAIMFERLGEPDKAVADYRKVLELAPSFAPARRNLARLRADSHWRGTTAP